MAIDRRRRTLDKLGEVSKKIEEILAGQEIRIGDIPLPHEAEPGETKLERLQRFKALLNETLAELNQREPRRCRACQEPLPDVQLDEMPWAWSCGACPGARA